MKTTSSLKLTKLRSSGKKNYITVDLLFIVLSLSSTLPILSKSILRDYKYISPDGFDMILEGRLIANSHVVFPVLRNPGFVSISWLDGLLGGHGITFWFANFCGLLLQYLALRMMAKYKKLPTPIFFFVFSVYFGSFIHFISYYILSDCLVIGIISIISSYAFVEKKITWKLIVGLGLLISFNSLCQIYGLISIVTLTIYFGKRKKYIELLILYVIIVILVISINVLFYSTIKHDMRPKQIELMAFSFDMFSFYLNLWLILFLPIVVILLLLLTTYRRVDLISKLKDIIIDKSLIPGFLILVLTFFYQWPESRFSYITFALIAPILLLKFAALIRNLECAAQARNLLFLGTILNIMIAIFASPSHYWQPTIDSLKLSNVWFQHPINSLKSESRESPYREYLEIIDNLCTSGTSPQLKKTTVLAMTEDPYTLTELKLASLYCVTR